MKTLEENESNKSSMVGRIIYRPNLAEQEIFFEILPLFFPRVIIVFFSFRTITRVREPDPSVTRPN